MLAVVPYRMSISIQTPKFVHDDNTPVEMIRYYDKVSDGNCFEGLTDEEVKFLFAIVRKQLNKGIQLGIEFTFRTVGDFKLLDNN